MAAGLASAALAWGIAAAEPMPVLDGLLAFKSPRYCTASLALERLMKSALVLKTRGEHYSFTLGQLQVPPAFREQVGKPTMRRDKEVYEAHIPLTGTWHGLPVRELAVYARPESEGGFWITFDAPTSEVLRVANAAGFGLGAKGHKYVDDPNDTIGVTISVFSSEGHGTLSCADG
jgi:hypothetical protein